MVAPVAVPVTPVAVPGMSVAAVPTAGVEGGTVFAPCEERGAGTPHVPNRLCTARCAGEGSTSAAAAAAVPLEIRHSKPTDPASVSDARQGVLKAHGRAAGGRLSGGPLAG